MHNFLSFQQRTVVKKLISGLLVLLLASSTLLESAAMASEPLVPMSLEAARLNEVPDGNYLYFGTASASVEESDAAYSVVIYREGDLSEEATVDIHTIDLSATYGKDYVLMMPDTEKTGDGKTILEKYLGDLDSYEDEVNAQDGEYYLIGEDEIVDEESDEDSAQKGSNYSDEENKEEISDEEYRAYLNSAVQEIMPQAMDNIGYSSKTTLTFAPGESEKTVVFRIKDDNKSEGTETFSLNLANAVGAEIYMVNTASIAIRDDEEKVHSKVSFSKSNYTAKNGSVTVTIKRSDADYSLVDLRLISSEGTAKAGENYEEMNEIVSFAPYEMEKDITIPVCGEGSFSLLIDEFTACKAGKHTKATVKILPSEENGIETYDAMVASSNEVSSFGITVNGKGYTVEYTPGEATGKILDKNYDPAVEVGIYYFALSTDKGGIFQYGDKYSYGDKPGKLGTLDSVYVYQDDDGNELAQHKAYGDIAYYNPLTWETGLVWATAQYNSMPGVFFQLVAPDWEGTKDVYGGQQFHISSSSLGLPATKIEEGKFDRTADNAALTLKNIESTQYNRKFHVSINAEDENSNRTPKCYLRFYGVACMYKKYEITTTNPSEMTFRNGTGGTSSSIPMEFRFDGGVVTNGSHYVYTNASTENSTFTFNLDPHSVNGVTEKYGTLDGYEIEIGYNAGNTVTKKYPQDFYTYLESAKSNSDSYVKYDADSVIAEENIIKGDLATIACDGYFVDWIDSVQKEVFDEGDWGYYQKLNFKPIFNPIDITVTVLKPSVGEGAFTDSEVAQLGAHTFHAGDKINLAATCTKAGYHVVGYEYSTNGGTNWNSQTNADEQYLFLDPRKADKGYYIRPLLAENTNCIEIVCDSSVSDKILGANSRGLIDNELLKEENLDGKYILSLNGTKDSTAEVQMTPTVGEVYAINFKAYKDGNDYYYPVITDAYGNSYNGQTFYYQARQTAADNALTLTYEKVANLQKYTISGKLMSNYLPVISTGTETKHLGIKGYTVSLAAGKVNEKATDMQIETVSATSDTNGAFTLNGVYGKSGDKLTMAVGNSTDTQIVTLTLGSSTSMDMGNTYLAYPEDAPYVASLDYKYGKSSNNTNAENTKNTIQIYDDNLTIIAQINTVKYDITKARFTVYTVDAANEINEDTVSTYYADVDPSNPGSFTVTINKMTESLHSGDRISVALGTETTVDGIETTMWYPDVETGYVFKTKNVELKPQSYSTKDTPSIDVPIIGATSASSSSGLLSFSRTDWGDNTGYTLSINIDLLCFNTTTPSTTEKMAKYDEFYASTKEAWDLKQQSRKDGKELTSLENYSGVLAAELEGNEIDLEILEEQESVKKQIKSQKNQLKQVNSGYKQAKNAVSQFSNNTGKIDILFLAAFDFVYDASEDEYIFCSGSVSAGGSMTVSTTQYVVISGVPLYFNITGFMQGDLTVHYPTGVDTVTAAKFEEYSGNIADMMTQSSAYMTLIFQLKGSVGVGMCNVIGAGGTATFQLQYSVPILGDDYGVFINATIGLKIDIFIGTIQVDAITGNLGFGTYENKTSLDLFGGAASIKSASMPDTLSTASDETKSEVTFHNYSLGTSDMSSFGKNDMIQATPTEVDFKVLLDNAGENSSPKIVDLGDGVKYLCFIGNREDVDDQFNSRALYYSIYDGDEWSKPETMNESVEKTFDSSPTVLKTDDNLAVAWVGSSDSAVNEDSTMKEKLDALDIYLSIYDVDKIKNNGTGYWKTRRQLLTDRKYDPHIPDDREYFDFEPQLNIGPGKIGSDILYCNYVKRDISNVSKAEDLLDLTDLYSLEAYVKYNPNLNTIVPTTDGYTESAVTIPHNEETEPLIFDYKCITTKVDGETYMVSAYTIDEDKDLTTGEDRELYLYITNLTTDKTYYPIRLTNDNMNQAAPKLTELNGEVYLTWLENGYLFNLMNVTELLKAFFHIEKQDDATAYITNTDIYRNSDEDDPYWYCKSAEEIGYMVIDDASNEGILVEDDDYDKTFYGLARRGTFKSIKDNFNSHDNLQTSISDYKMVTNGEDIYIFYTDFGSSDPDDLSVELYGVRYQSESTGEGKEAGFGQAVQITDYGKVIDNFDLIMDEDGNITLVSDFYSQKINESTGTLERGKNQLVEIEFEPRGSVSIVDDNVDFPMNLVKGSNGYITFEVVNDGLMPTDSFEITASAIKNGNETIIYNEIVDMELNSGETYEVEIPWTIPDDLSDTEIKVTVNECNVAISHPSTVTVTAPYRSTLIISEPVAKWDGSSCTMTAKVTNIGNKKADAYTAQVCINDGTKATKIYATQELPAIDSGESVEISIPFTPDVDDFSDLGVINMMMRAMDGDEQVSCAYTKLVPGMPVVAKINDGNDSLKLTSGNSSKLNIAAAPWGNIADGKARFVSSDPTIASVDSTGTVSAGAAGSATITAYYASGATQSIVVNVAASDTNADHNSSYDGSDNSYVSSTPPKTQPADVIDNSQDMVFTDVSSDAYYAEAVNWAVKEKITSGIGDRKFAPDMACTRAQIVSLMWRAAGAPEPATTVHPFTDVSADDYYFKAMLWAIENGITVGTSATTFSPNAPCTRAQAVNFIYRYEKSQGGGFTDAWMLRLPFTDVSEADYEAVAWCYMNKITGGISDTLFAPKDACTRGQIVTFLYRYAKCEN